MGKKIDYSEIANTDWNLWKGDDNTYSWDVVKTALLMDIRAELKRLNRVMQCPNVQTGFRALGRIAAQSERAFKRRVVRAVGQRIRRRKAKR